MSEFQSIKVVRVSKGRYCISIIWTGVRYRYYNGKKIGSWSVPNKSPIKSRVRAFEKLRVEFQRAIDIGWSPTDDWSHKLNLNKATYTNALNEALRIKLDQGLSESYARKLKWIVKHLNAYLKGKEPTPELLAKFINDSHWTNANRNIIRRHLMALEKPLIGLGYNGSIKDLTTRYRIEEKLHKPFRDVGSVLREIESFDTRLHLCCLLAYGCLLRPHREIRLLTWGDFSEDLRQVSLSGSQNKGKRNRIVPVNSVIEPYLRAFKGSNSGLDDNVFTGTPKPYNQSYFSLLWSRYKKYSSLLTANQTLYSFRHTGAIEVYKKTRSISTLQSVLGHKSLQTSIIYIRNLEVPQIQEIDLPGI